MSVYFCWFWVRFFIFFCVLYRNYSLPKSNETNVCLCEDIRCVHDAVFVAGKCSIHQSKIFLSWLICLNVCMTIWSHFMTTRIFVKWVLPVHYVYIWHFSLPVFIHDYAYISQFYNGVHLIHVSSFVGNTFLPWLFCHLVSRV